MRLPDLRLVLVVAACAACSVATDRPAVQGRWFVDDFGDSVSYGTAAPRRIVSLTPATTELLFALGAGSRLVGRTRWDKWPDSAQFIPDVGDGLRPNVEAVLAARPELVLLYAANENRTAASRLRDAGIVTLSLKTDLPAHFVELTRVLGHLLHDSVTAATVIDSVTSTLDSVRALTSGLVRPRVFWIAELEPLIAIGGGSFLSELIQVAGAENVYEDILGPSAPISLEDVVRRNPAIIIGGASAISEIQRAPGWRSIDAVQSNRLLIADSFVLGRPSVRMGEAAVQLLRMLHPEVRR